MPRCAPPKQESATPKLQAARRTEATVADATNLSNVGRLPAFDFGSPLPQLRHCASQGAIPLVGGDGSRSDYCESPAAACKIGHLLFERTAVAKKPEKLIEQDLAALRDEDRMTPERARNARRKGRRYASVQPKFSTPQPAPAVVRIVSVPVVGIRRGHGVG